MSDKDAFSADPSRWPKENAEYKGNFRLVRRPETVTVTKADLCSANSVDRIAQRALIGAPAGAAARFDLPLEAKAQIDAAEQRRRERAAKRAKRTSAR